MGGSNVKSNMEVDKLVDEVLLHPDFNLEDIKGFKAQRVANQINKNNESEGSIRDQFEEASVSIDVPLGCSATPSRTFQIPGLHFQRLTSLIHTAFAHPLAAHFHLSSYKLYHTSPANNKTQRVFSEVYDSDWAPNPPDDPHCKCEKVVAAMMFWSDSTHLANFRTAKLWLIYMFLGNLSKYIRAMPNSSACQHVAYIPSLPDSFQDELMKWHTQWSKPKHRQDVLAHCWHELMHAVWKLLLDDDFIHAYKYGMVIKCINVLLATIRDKGLCLCPQCLVTKPKLDLMGLVQDICSRVSNVRKYLFDKVVIAHWWIYTNGRGIKSVNVEALLKETSAVPTINAFVNRLGTEFELSRMMVPDFMHEFELGVWKALFTHLIRVLYAACPNGHLVTELDARISSQNFRIIFLAVDLAKILMQMPMMILQTRTEIQSRSMVTRFMKLQHAR
ncbi:hypothetical protein BDQ12DRAFT_700924 [Crucibulum laeve]|uniref:Uncharacterized protein n=1 Tax=Crucibulum laeve TaxID=68775 RepID=A0A5C3LM80_9AGAR|nr:hypothetical protein BDQ12DRAFT_700924 [Crucibulum laeve]